MSFALFHKIYINVKALHCLPLSLHMKFVPVVKLQKFTMLKYFSLKTFWFTMVQPFTSGKISTFRNIVAFTISSWLLKVVFMRYAIFFKVPKDEKLS